MVVILLMFSDLNRITKTFYSVLPVTDTKKDSCGCHLISKAQKLQNNNFTKHLIILVITL